MRRAKFFGLAVLVVFACAAAMSASASALILPLNLPQQATWTGDSEGTSTLQSLGGTITCQKATATGTEEISATHSLGTFAIDFKECKEEKNKIACNSKGDAKEIILSTGKWHLVYDKLGAEAESTLGVAILFLLEPVTLECTALLKIVITGQVLCLVLEYKSSNVKHNFHCIAKETGSDVATAKEWFNKEDKENNPGTVQLLCSFNGGKAEECAELALGLDVFPKPVVIDG